MSEKNKNNWPEKTAELRRAAEKIVVLSPKELEALSPEETRRTLHELQVHQIELQMQNEELCRAQLALDAARIRYFDLYDLAPVGYVTLSEKGLILEANLTAATMLCVARDVLVQRSIVHFIFPEDQDAYYLCRKNLIETGSAQMCELRLLRKDATQFWARIEAVLAAGEDGALLQRVVMIDISEKKAAADAAIAAERLARQRADTLLSLYSMAPGLTDPELYDLALDKAVQITASCLGLFHIISDDQKTILLTTWNSAALKGCTAPADIHYPTENAGNWADCVRLRSPVIYNDYSISPGQKGLPKGHSPLGRFMGVPVIYNGEVKLIFGVANKREDYNDADVAQLQLVGNELFKIIKQRRSDEQLKQMAQKANEASEAKSQFLANMSHELRTPMNAIIGMTELALMTDLTEMQNKYLAHVKSGANKLLGVINKLLDLSKIEAGKMEISLSRFCIGDLIRERILMFKTLTRDKPIIFESIFGNDLPDFLIGDPQHLNHILSNLLANAINFTESGTITVTVKEVGKNEKSITLKFMVTDTGIGIPEDKLNLLFCKFSQIDSSMTRKYGGTGLGLAISKDLVELMGGEIGVQSDPGKGSSFYFTITFDLPPRQ